MQPPRPPSLPSSPPPPLGRGQLLTEEGKLRPRGRWWGLAAHLPVRPQRLPLAPLLLSLLCAFCQPAQHAPFSLHSQPGTLIACRRGAGGGEAGQKEVAARTGLESGGSRGLCCCAHSGRREGLVRVPARAGWALHQCVCMCASECVYICMCPSECVVCAHIVSVSW